MCRRDRYTVEKVSKDGADLGIQMKVVSSDAKGKSNMSNTMQTRCNGNEIRVDASTLIGQEQNKQFEAFDMKFTSKDIVFPAKLSVGQTLLDASLHGEGRSGPVAITTDMTITNRKVDGKETIKVPAGTFETVSYTHLDVYKRQLIPCVARICLAR